MLTLLVSLAAGAGAVSRYLVDRTVQRRTRGGLPFGTFAVNVTGSFFLGLVVGLAAHHGLPSRALLVLGTGFAGGYTTLSTWAWESLALTLEDNGGTPGHAALNVVGSLAFGLAAAAAGLGLALL